MYKYIFRLKLIDQAEIGTEVCTDQQALYSTRPNIPNNMAITYGTVFS